MSILSLLFLLLFAHALADYPLQGDFLSKAKNRLAPIPNVPWYTAMFAHAMIHAGMVFIITQFLVLALIELVAHFIIDDLKCKGKLSFNADQILHVACKVFYVGVIYLWSLYYGNPYVQT